MNLNERLIVRTMIAEGIKAGWKLIELDDGDDRTPLTSTDQVMLLLSNLEEGQLHFVEDASGNEAWVRLIFGNGNDGFDVISDYHTNIELWMTHVSIYTEKAAEAFQGANMYVACSFDLINPQDKLILAAPRLQAALDLILAAAVVNGRSPTELIAEIRGIAQAAVDSI